MRFISLNKSSNNLFIPSFYLTMKTIVVLIFIICFSAPTYGQNSSNQYSWLVEEAFELIKQQKIPAAIAKCKLALEIDSSKVDAYYVLGVAYLHECQNQNKNCEISLFYLNKSIKINSSFKNGYYNRGQCKGKIGDYKGALKDFGLAIEMDSNNVDAYFCRGMIKIKLMDNQGACEDFYISALLGDEIGRKLFEKNCGIKKK